MCLLLFATGGVKIAQQENDGHRAGKRFLPMLKFNTYRDAHTTKKILNNTFFLFVFPRRNFPALLPLRTKRIPKYYHIFKKERKKKKKCLYILCIPSKQHLSERNKKLSSLFPRLYFSLVCTFTIINPRFWVDITLWIIICIDMIMLYVYDRPKNSSITIIPWFRFSIIIIVVFFFFFFQLFEGTRPTIKRKRERKTIVSWWVYI